MDSLRKLVSIGSDSIRGVEVDPSVLANAFDKETADQLRAVLKLKNGFYAFEGALHVLSDLGTGADKGLLDWNRGDLWRDEYQGMAAQGVFFAEDVFGGQFCIFDGKIASFDPETGTMEVMAESIEEWADKILRDYDFLTGYSVAHAWQLEHGPIPVGARLVPTTPFVMGGDFSASNVHAIDAVEGMKVRASIAVQIRDVPDGTSIRLRVTDR